MNVRFGSLAATRPNQRRGCFTPESGYEGSAGAASASGKSAEEGKGSATSQGATTHSAKLSTEQRTKISAIFTKNKVAPEHLNVAASVGTRVPDSVHFYPLPQEVFVIYPEWRGYEYIVVGDEVLVIDPRSHEIVASLRRNEPNPHTATISRRPGPFAAACSIEPLNSLAVILILKCPLWVKSCRDGWRWSCPLYPRKRTLPRANIRPRWC
jgi:hypothetical protein